MLFWKKRSKQESQTISREHIMQWRDDEIPRYPPFMKGLPSVSPEKLLETQAELIERIADTAISLPTQFERYYLSAIERFARFAHLLPASQSHHHRGAGGLLRHSIEVGLWALQSADKVLLDAAKTPSQRREMEPRWQLAVFLAALCHDAGKPVTDIIVTNKDRTAIWKPIKEDLYAWATKNGIEAYFLDWREGRARQHTALSNLIADRIIGAETLEWIEEGGTELIVWLVESLTSNPSPTNLIHDLVIKADQTSVERDLKTLGVAMAGYDLGVPVERHLTDIMRRFIKEGVWLVNEPGARLWNIGGNIYLVWPAAGEEIARQVREDGIPGIPRTPDGIMDMLVERQIAFVREGVAPRDRLWKIAPAVLAEKIPDIKLSAIRLRDEAMVSSVPIPSVDGKVINEPESGKHEDSAAPRQTLEQSDNAHVTGDVDGHPVAEQHEPKNSATSEMGFEGMGDKSPSSPNPASHEDWAMEATAVAPDRTASDSNNKVSRPALGENDHGEFRRSQNTTSHSLDPDRRNKISLTGPVGEAIKAMAQDLKSGDKQWGIDAVVDKDRQVVLKWPDSFSGYGLTAKAILDELSAREWLWIDPMAPLKKVLEMEIGGVQAKAIRLERDVSEVFVHETGGTSRGDIAREKRPQEVSAQPKQAERSFELAAKPKPAPISSEIRQQTMAEPGGSMAAAMLDQKHGPGDLKHGAEPRSVKSSKRKSKASKPSDEPNSKKQTPTSTSPPSGDGGVGVMENQKKSRAKHDHERVIALSCVLPSDHMEAGQNNQPVATSTPSLDQVIDTLSGVPGVKTLDGWFEMPKYEAMAALKAKGMKLTHSALAMIGEHDPSRFAVVGSIVRYRG